MPFTLGDSTANNSSETKDYCYKARIRSTVLQGLPFGGIPTVLALDFLCFLLLLFLFSVLRKVAWDYGRLALVTDVDRLRRQQRDRVEQEYMSSAMQTDSHDRYERLTSVSSSVDFEQRDNGFCSWLTAIFRIKQVQVPSSQEQEPSRQEQVPNRQEQLPSSQEKVPSRQEQVPSRQERMPSRKERVFSREEQMPSREEQMPSRQEQVPIRQEGVPRRQEGMSSSQEGVSSSQKQLPRSTEELLSKQEQLLSRSKQLSRSTKKLLRRQYLPPIREDLLPNWHGPMHSREDLLPGWQGRVFRQKTLQKPVYSFEESIPIWQELLANREEQLLKRKGQDGDFSWQKQAFSWQEDTVTWKKEAVSWEEKFLSWQEHESRKQTDSTDRQSQGCRERAARQAVLNNIFLRLAGSATSPPGQRTEPLSDT